VPPAEQGSTSTLCIFFPKWGVGEAVIM